MTQNHKIPESHDELVQAYRKVRRERNKLRLWGLKSIFDYEHELGRGVHFKNLDRETLNELARSQYWFREDCWRAGIDIFCEPVTSDDMKGLNNASPNAHEQDPLYKQLKQIVDSHKAGIDNRGEALSYMGDFQTRGITKEKYEEEIPNFLARIAWDYRI